MKEPKYYFYDIGNVKNGEDAVLENAVACSLLKDLHFREDTLGIKAELFYLKDKEGRETDFLTVIDDEPKMIIEVK